MSNKHKQQIRASRPTLHTTTFSCHSDSAQAVCLAGSFNDWSPTATPMVRSRRGDWTLSVPLAPGHDEYKFVVDGEWCCHPGDTALDAQHPDCVTNEFGTMNRAIEVA